MSTPTRRRAVGYLRVSTDRQAEEGFGLDVQRRSVQAWARSNDASLVAVFADEGVSGAHGLEGRFALAEALDCLRERRASILVVHRLDRLARDLVVQETLLAEVRRRGAEVASTSAAEAGYLADDPDDPSRTLIRQVLGAVAQYDRAMISLRLRAGRQRKAASGGYAYGSPPFGLRAEGRALVVDEEEHATVARVQCLYSSGLSIRAIASVLNDEGVPTKRGASRWHPTTVSRLLNRAT